MEQAPRTSFIPKQAPGAPTRRQHRTFNILAFFATIIFIASLLLSAFVYLYHAQRVSELEKQKAALADLKKTFSDTDISRIKDMQRKLDAADLLLSQHLSLTTFLAALEARTQANAQITSLNFERLPSGSAEVELQGKTGTFNTVALQEREYASERSFREGTVDFHSLNISPSAVKGKDTVTFTVSAALDTEVVGYNPPILPAAEVPAFAPSEVGTDAGENSVTE